MFGVSKRKAIKIEEERVAQLQASLASLMALGLFVEEKQRLIDSIREQYMCLEHEDKMAIDGWLDGRYKTFLEKLITYDKNIHNVVDLVNYCFRWGLSGSIAQDIEFAYYLIDPIISREKFNNESISSYAYLTHGSILFHYYRESITHDESNRMFLFQRAVGSLRLSYGSAKNDYLKNRSAYFLTQLYTLNGDFTTAVVWYFRSLDCSDLVHDQFSMIFTLIFRDIDPELVLSFNNIGKIFTKERVQNRDFWHFVKRKMSNALAIDHINTLVALSDTTSSVENWGSEVELFFDTLEHYISVLLEPMDKKSNAVLQNLYFGAILNDRGKAAVLFRMAEIQQFYNEDRERAMLMASESNGLFFTSKRLDFMSRILLEPFAIEIRRILNGCTMNFKGAAVAFYCAEKERKVVAWRRLLKRGCLSGRLDEEVEFLEYLKHHTLDKILLKVLKTRLAYLYFKGTAGISEDGYLQPNYQKSKEYFEDLQENPLVAKYLKHPKLSIYLSLEKGSPLGDINYLFFEKKMSSKLLIVFSCAFSYMHYTQLREFYQRNKVNVLFISNPALNWYHDQEWSRIESLMKQVVLKRFQKENITTYFGSMGGYAALRVALTYGLKAVVFNPQIDLNIWIKHRPLIATRLKPYSLVHIQEFSITAFENAPLYILSSSSIEDVEVFKILLEKFALCQKGLFIIEKIPDNLHAGIFAKVYSKNQQNSILNISAIQDKYYPSKKYEKIPYQISPENATTFWRFVNRSMKIRLIIQIERGNIFCAKVQDNFGVKPRLSSLDDELKS